MKISVDEHGILEIIIEPGHDTWTRVNVYLGRAQAQELIDQLESYLAG